MCTAMCEDTMSRELQIASENLLRSAGSLAGCPVMTERGEKGVGGKEGHERGDICDGSESKESACSVGNQGSIPGSGRSLGEGNANPLQ